MGDVCKGFDVDELDKLETIGLYGFKRAVSVVLTRENIIQSDKSRIRTVQGVLHGPMDARTKLKVKFRSRDIDLRERRRRLKKVDETTSSSANAAPIAKRRERCS